MYFSRIKLVLLTCLGLCWISDGFGQTAEVTQRVLPATRIDDLEFLNTFLEEQFILPKDTAYTHGVFFDLTRDGFGSNDILILHPANEQFMLGTYLPEKMAEVLNTQGLSTDYSLTTSRDRIPLVIEEGEQDKDPKKALAGLFMESTENYHSGGDIEGYISMQGDNIQVSFWDYTESLWRYIPPEIIYLESDIEPVILLIHKQPEIRAFLDSDGCVVIESNTEATPIITRKCENKK